MAKVKVNNVNDEMELYIDPIGLIESVKERSVLYTLTRSASLRAKRNNAWTEVAEEIIPNWSELSRTEQDLCEAELQKKWNNLKDSYIKAYKKEVLANAVGAKKHKQYVYFEALSFLKPNVANKMMGTQHIKKIEKFDNSHTDTNDIDANDIDANYEDTNDEDNEYLHDRKKSTEYTRVTTPKMEHIHAAKRKYQNAHEDQKNTSSKKMKLKDCVSDLVSSLTNEKKPDSDDMFLLSLSPYLKQLNDRKKMEAQIEILTLIKQRTLDQEYE